jgi:hypothetical protein
VRRKTLSAFIGYFVIVSGIFAYRSKTAKWRTFRIIAGAGYLLVLVLGTAVIAAKNPREALVLLIVNSVLGSIVYFIWEMVTKDRAAMDKAAAEASK